MGPEKGWAGWDISMQNSIPFTAVVLLHVIFRGRLGYGGGGNASAAAKQKDIKLLIWQFKYRVKTDFCQESCKENLARHVCHF